MATRMSLSTFSPLGGGDEGFLPRLGSKAGFMRVDVCMEKGHREIRGVEGGEGEEGGGERQTKERETEAGEAEVEEVERDTGRLKEWREAKVKEVEEKDKRRRGKEKYRQRGGR